MNTTEHIVTKILNGPYFNVLWCVDVEADSWGSIQKTTVYCKTENEAKKVKIGYRFEA
jgi:hypothetical protein